MRTEIGALLVILLIAAMLGLFLRARPKNLATPGPTASSASSKLTTAPQGGCSEYSIDGITLGMQYTEDDLNNARGIDESLRVFQEPQSNGKTVVARVEGASLYRGKELIVRVGDPVERLRGLPLNEGAFGWGRRYDLPLACGTEAVAKAYTTATLGFRVDRDQSITIIDMRMR